MRPFRCSLLISGLFLLCRVSPVFCGNNISSDDTRPSTISLIMPTGTIRVISDASIVPVHLWPTPTPNTPSITNNPDRPPQTTGQQPEQSGQGISEPYHSAGPQPFVRSYRRGHHSGTGASALQAEPQGASGSATQTTEYFGSLPRFSNALSYLSALLGADNNVIAIVTDLDKTIHYSSNELGDGINKASLILQQQEVMRVFSQWLTALPEELRRRFLFIINTSRTVTTDPNYSGENGFL